MLDLKTPPSTSASTDSPNGHVDSGASIVAITPESVPVGVRRPERGRSLAMQWRFLRVLWFSAGLFARVIFWHIIVARYWSDYVDRTSLARWTRYARSFRRFAFGMGGVMIKLGQFISTRADILPEEVIAELASLRDEVPGVPVDQIRAIITREIGPIDDHFEWFDNMPVAAASLGQVHRARLKNGDRVVVKVQRPGIDEVCLTDLDALHIVARVASKFRFINRRADAPALTHEFGRVLMEELSYRLEAHNGERFAQMFREDLGVYIPQVYTDFSTDRVLTMEDVTTIKINDYAALEAAGISRKAVAQRLMDTYLKQVFEERFFHADPHPGNLFVYPLPLKEGETYNGNGRPFYLIFVDFGMTGSLTPQIVGGLVNTLSAVITRDAHKLVRSYQELGFLLPGADTAQIEAATKAVFDQVWGMDMTQMANVGYDQMAVIGNEFNELLFDMPFQMPQDFIYLGRTFSILFGMCTSLDPTFNPWQELQPYTRKLMAQSLSASEGGLAGLAGPVLQNLGGSVLSGIGQAILGRPGASANDTAQIVLNRLERGDIALKVEPNAAFERRLARIEAQNRRTTRAVYSGSLLVAATIFYTSGQVAPAAIGYVLSGLFFLSSLLAAE